MSRVSSVTVVVPVYGDWPSLKVCINSLIQTLNHDTDKVLLVNDCGPEADLIEKNIKDMIKDKKNFRYERNKENLGFVKTCNKAVLDLEKSGNDIMLLNSDAALTKGAIEDMKRLMADNNNVGAVSPRSNNATICTMPIKSIDQKGVPRKQSYRLFRKYYKHYDWFTETPTAHGFCMLIRRRVIDQYGLFDEVFGRGYGEEVDFCQRIRAEGWTTVIDNWAFAYHLEARSFSMEAKQELLRANGRILKDRYPSYSQEVRKKIAELKLQEDNMFNIEDIIAVRVMIIVIKLRKKMSCILVK